MWQGKSQTLIISRSLNFFALLSSCLPRPGSWKVTKMLKSKYGTQTNLFCSYDVIERWPLCIPTLRYSPLKTAHLGFAINSFLHDLFNLHLNKNVLKAPNLGTILQLSQHFCWSLLARCFFIVNFIIIHISLVNQLLVALCIRSSTRNCKNTSF